MTTEIWSRPVRVKQRGDWAWIDPTLVEQNGVVKPKVIKGELSLPTGDGSDPITTFAPSPQQSLALSWPTELPKPTLDRSRAVYTDAAGPGADLVITALSTGFRYDVVLRDRPAKAPELTIPMQGKGLSLREAADGRLRLTDKDGASVAIAAKPTLHAKTASKTHDGERGTVDVKVRTDNGQQTLLIKPDPGFLADPATSYPVTLSSVFGMQLIADTDVNSVVDFNNVDGPFLKAGTTSGGEKARTYLKFDLSPLTGQNVSNATLSLLNVDGPSCGTNVGAGVQVRRVTSAWNPFTITWSPQPTNTTVDAVTNTSSVRSGSCNPAPMNWNITAIANQWTGEAGNYGLVLMSPTENNSANFRVFPSSEDTDFNTPPKLTAAFTPIGGPTVVNPAGSGGVEVFTAPDNWGVDSLPLAESQAHALSSAQDRVEAHPNVLAPPHVDMVSGQVVVPAAADAGRATASQALIGTAILSHGATDWTVPGEYTGADTDEDGEGPANTTEDYTFTPYVPAANAPVSISTLTGIAEEALDLNTSQLPGADNLIAAGIWPERGQVILQATAVTSQLRLALAQRYGVSAVAIWLRPNAARLVPADSRLNDNDGFINGGSGFTETDGTGLCTTGFAWGTAAQDYMITAGHCMPRNGSGLSSIGALTGYPNLTSTWIDGVGSAKLAGQSTYYGDVAQLEIIPGKHTASIFVGGVNSTTKKAVAGRWSRRAQVGDQYCVGGARTGQTCGWKVSNLGWKVEYEDAGQPIETVRWVHVGKKRYGACAAKGDSGGPVYTFRSDQYVTAKGITSGSNYENPTNDNCQHTFTDIHDVVKAFGGDIKKRS